MEASSRGWRWFYAGFIAVLVAYAVMSFAFEGIPWYTRAIPVLLLVGNLPAAVGRFAYTEVTREGLSLDVRVRRRRLGWSEVDEIQLGGPYGRRTRLELTDGTEVKSLALGGFVAGPDADPALIERLERESETHGFSLIAR